MKIKLASRHNARERAAIRDMTGDDPARAEFLQDCREQDCLYVMTSGTQVAALGTLNYIVFNCGFIPLVVVAESHRRRGFGGQMIRHLESLCVKAKLFTSTSASNRAMRALLQKLGYREAGTIRGLDGNDPEVFYCKVLTTA
jgi:ribosomal protein S18 acetylase RimI-like enzyme